MMENKYMLSLKQEVLSEVGAEIIADLLRTMTDNHIDETKKDHMLSILFWMVVEIKDSLYSPEVQDMETIYKIIGQLQFIKDYLSVLKESAIFTRKIE